MSASQCLIICLLILLSSSQEFIIYVEGGSTTPAGRILGSSEPPEDTYSIAPVADCGGPEVDFGAQVRQCYMDCVGATEPSESATLRVYHAQGEGPKVVECSKVLLKQAFTQTWTFSTIKGSLDVSKEIPTESECRDSISKHCPDMRCDMREPNALDEEYHYGSVTTKQQSYITLITTSSMLFFKNNETLVSPTGKDVSFPNSAQVGKSDGSIFFWEAQSGIRTCPFKSVGSYGCDKFQDKEEDFYVCDGGRVVVTPQDDDVDILDVCPDLKVSIEGFIYKMTKDDPKSVKTGRLAIDVYPGQVESEDDSYLRHKLQQIYKRLDSDICMTRCELLTVESRLHANESRLVRSGIDSYLLLPNGTAQFCKPNHGCRLPESPVFCGSPPRVSIICTGYTRYWNPLVPYTTPGTECRRPSDIEKLIFNMGTTHYEVDNDLKIKMPNHNYHHRYPNKFLEYHNSGMFLKVKTLQEMKSKWEDAKLKNPSVAVAQSSDTKIDAPHISIGEALTNGVKNIISGFKTLEAAIGFIFICFVIYITVVVIEKTTGVITRVRKSTYSPVRAAEPVRVEMTEPIRWI